MDNGGPLAETDPILGPTPLHKVLTELEGVMWLCLQGDLVSGN